MQGRAKVRQERASRKNPPNVRSEDVTNPFDLEMLAILEVSEAFQITMEEFRAWCISFERDLGGVVQDDQICKHVVARDSRNTSWS